MNDKPSLIKWSYYNKKAMAGKLVFVKFLLTKTDKKKPLF